MSLGSMRDLNLLTKVKCLVLKALHWAITVFFQSLQGLEHLLPRFDSP